MCLQCFGIYKSSLYETLGGRLIILVTQMYLVLFDYKRYREHNATHDTPYEKECIAIQSGMKFNIVLANIIKEKKRVKYRFIQSVIWRDSSYKLDCLLEDHYIIVTLY